MAPSRSLTGRLALWLVPFAVILVGLAVVAYGLSRDDESSDDIAAPPNVQAVTTMSAAAWAARQAAPGFTASIESVSIIDSTAIGDTTYDVRAVVVRIDAPTSPSPTQRLADDSQSVTVATCVHWIVDVSNGSMSELGASELSHAPGGQPTVDPDDVRHRCAEADLASSRAPHLPIPHVEQSWAGAVHGEGFPGGERVRQPSGRARRR